MNVNYATPPGADCTDAEIYEDALYVLFAMLGDDSTEFGKLDSWTQRRIVAENLTKIKLVLGSDDPAEECCRNLIRELDAEAKIGVLLVPNGAKPDLFRRAYTEPGVSGELYRYMPTLAVELFPNELERSNDQIDTVWATAHAIHNRAILDAIVSERVMEHFVEGSGTVATMVDAMCSLFYSYHEDATRQKLGLPSLLDEADTRYMLDMVSQLIRQADANLGTSVGFEDQRDEARTQAPEYVP